MQQTVQRCGPAATWQQGSNSALIYNQIMDQVMLL